MMTVLLSRCRRDIKEGEMMDARRIDSLNVDCECVWILSWPLLNDASAAALLPWVGPPFLSPNSTPALLTL